MQITKLLVQNILLHPFDFEWSVQGLGMMRVYLSPLVRLHVWDRALLIPGASPVHTHPWDFTSKIIAGRMHNRRFVQVAFDDGEAWNRVEIKCGEGAHPTSEIEHVGLLSRRLETYGPDSEYTQSFDEIHWSLPEDGTVTIVTRNPKADPEHAYVFWRGRGPWVDAMPRPAERHEVADVTQRALETWF